MGFLLTEEITVQAGEKEGHDFMCSGVGTVLDPNDFTVDEPEKQQEELNIYQKFEAEQARMETELAMANVQNALNVRAQANEKSEKVGFLYKDCGGTILEQENGWTLFDYAIYPHGHLLVKLTPSDECKGERIGTPLLTDAQAEAATEAHLSGTIPVSLDEPNVLLLDRPKWRMAGDAEWQPAEEIGECAVRYLDGMIRRGEKPPMQTIIPSVLVKRASTSIYQPRESSQEKA